MGDVFVIDEPLYHYRKYNTNSITTTYKSDLNVKWQCLYAKIGDLVGEDRHQQKLFHYRHAFSTIGLGLNELNNSEGFLSIYKALFALVSNHLYDRSYHSLPLSRLNIHWQFFFLFARYKFTPGIFLMLRLIKAIINRGN